MELFGPQLYLPVYLFALLFLTLWQASVVNKMKYRSIVLTDNNNYVIGLFIFLFVIVVGLRPVDYFGFGDTVNYARSYNALADNSNIYLNESEWVFYGLLRWFAKGLHVDVTFFFLLVEVLYVVPMWLACRRMASNNVTLLMLFVFGAFSFFTYGVNGIRNGMALSLVMLAITYIDGNARDKFICFLLCFLGFYSHHSASLPIVAMLFTYFYRKPKIMFYFWIASIFLSLFLGGAATTFFEFLGFDDRGYLGGEGKLDSGAVFSKTGFRWDFLLYGSMPILLGWYAVFKRKVIDNTYIMLLGTYIYSNAFWVMVIRAPFSNRFAYLSWFLYPIVLAYPLLKLPIFEKQQGHKTAIILLAHFAFTFFMWLIGNL